MEVIQLTSNMKCKVASCPLAWRPRVVSTQEVLLDTIDLIISTSDLSTNCLQVRGLPFLERSRKFPTGIKISQRFSWSQLRGKLILGCSTNQLLQTNTFSHTNLPSWAKMASMNNTREVSIESLILKFWQEQMRVPQETLCIKCRAVDAISFSLQTNTWRSAILNTIGSSSLSPSQSHGLLIILWVMSNLSIKKILRKLWWPNKNLSCGCNQSMVIIVLLMRSLLRCQILKVVSMESGNQVLMLLHITTATPERMKRKENMRPKESQKESSLFWMLMTIKELSELKEPHSGPILIK